MVMQSEQEKLQQDRLVLPRRGAVAMFSGQGSQKPGMGADVVAIPEAAAVFECASDVFGRDMRALCLESSAEELNETRNAQAALCTLSVALYRAMEARGFDPVAMLGFSLGQIAALAASGMLSDEETFKLLVVRADCMARAAAEYPGAMAAVLKGDEAAVRELCETCAEGDVLVPANFNSPGQIVVSGTEAAVARLEEQVSERGMRAARLATSGAFHSPLMAQAAQEFGAYLEGVSFAEPCVPVLCNVTASPLRAGEAASRLKQHLTNPVRFEQSVRAAIEAGADSMVEVGFGGVLVGLVRRIDKTVSRACVQDAASMEALFSEEG